MTQHVMKSDLARLLASELTPGETLALVRHLESCSECAGAAADTVDPKTVADLWGDALQASLGDHLRGDELSDYVDGVLPSSAMRDARAHLDHCTVCRDDVLVLRRLTRRRASWQWPRVALSAAAVIVVVIGLGLLVRRALPTSAHVGPLRPAASGAHPLAPPDPSPAAWQALVDAAVTNGRIAPPAILATLRMPGDVTRGDGVRQDSATTPNDVVIEETRPTFRWSGSPGGVYTVSILDGDREVARSAPLRSSDWTPERDLERGRTYRWQVKASRGRDKWIIPPAPSPAPIFALLDDAAHRDLDSARRSHPDDHLLLGVLAAHYGLQKEALEELARNHSARNDAGSAALVDSVRAWPKGEGR